MASSSPRAVIYARYSTDLQSEKSIEDQVSVCRDYAEKQGFSIVKVFTDHAVPVLRCMDAPAFKVSWCMP